MNSQKFINELKKDSNLLTEIRSITNTYKFEVLFLAQDYTGNVHLFNKKPIPFHMVGFEKEDVLWDRNDTSSSHMYDVGKFPLFDENGSKLIMIKNSKNIKFKIMKLD